MASDVSPQWAHGMRIFTTCMAPVALYLLVMNVLEGTALGCLAAAFSLGLSVWQINHWLRKESDLR